LAGAERDVVGPENHADGDQTHALGSAPTPPFKRRPRAVVTVQNAWYEPSHGSVLLLAPLVWAITFGGDGLHQHGAWRNGMIGGLVTFVGCRKNHPHPAIPQLFGLFADDAVPLAFIVAGARTRHT